ncbi:pyruvate carboxylase subunit B [Verrucomicrobiaceae bacterium N1E253]|uniref:Pyruvate carboxylase subunit B n=1 Tax=Oceaniferula marina TaxID=2748318 RepID=A0A851GD06_9BACT|nr:pyruvate carboxylase subunit B [Oceaniferula marina]NWK54822.1 pyruvate carboxylase subunit B [Oceaniferula marina]
METKPVIFNNTVLRDGHQSLAATRMKTEQMLDACPILDSMGYGSLETWGGATIDAGLRFLNEFPFDRLDALKAACPKTPHMMLLRGQNIVQYAHFPNDVVEAFIHSSAKHGMDIFRIFDALNDPRNMECAIKAAKAAGKQAHGVICYTTSPVHNVESFVQLGIKLESMGADAIVVKDMAGLIPPQSAKEIVSGLKENIQIPVWIHTHETAGLGAATYLAAIDAGVDAIDVSIAPFANGTGQPDALRMLALLDGHPRKPEISPEYLEQLEQLRQHFTEVYGELSDYTNHRNEVVDSDTLRYQVPGGMLSNFRNQLKEQKMEDKFEDVFAEIPVVREALGWIPLVTPTSQIVGVQAMLNVKFGRWKNFSPQAMDIALGYYGSTPAPVDPEVQKLAAKQAGKDPITCRPADLKEPGMDKLREELEAKGYPSDDEHCVIHAMFPMQLDDYYNSKKKAEEKAEAPAKATPAAETAAVTTPTSPAGHPDAKVRNMSLTINGTAHHVLVEEL